LIVDQFEEVFAETVPGPDRAAFIEAICGAAAAAAPTVCVVLGVRADFYRDCLRHDSLRAHLQDDQVIVGPLSDAELREAIMRPAERGGWRLDEGLADLVMADFGGTDSMLPLLSTALEQTWVRRTGRRLTIEGYRQAGGVTGAVAKIADEFHAGLDSGEREALRLLLVRLVGFRDDGKITAARVTRAELLNGLPAPDVQRRVLDELITRRLVIAEDTTVRVAHEALLWHWPHMGEWINANQS
jgi:hypothetical protein